MSLRTILATLLIAAPMLVQAEDSNDLKSYATMTVRGEAVSKVTPDQVILPVTVQEENPILKVARDRHDMKLMALLKLAADTGIAPDKIRTNYTSVNPQYDYSSSSSKPHLRGYQVQTSVEFTLTDLSKLGLFMNSVTDLGIDTLGSVEYGLQDESKVKEDTLMKAMENAEQKARRLAATAKVALDKPITINEEGIEINRPIPPHVMRANFMMAASAPMSPPELPSGVIEVHQSVAVTYALK